MGRRKANTFEKPHMDVVKDFMAEGEDKRRIQTELPPVPELTIDLNEFPFIHKDNRPRKIVFDYLSPTDVGALEHRGYKVVLLRAMPRETARDNIDFLLAFLQGVTDGTVEMSKQRGEATFLEMKARGLFADRTGTLVLTAKQAGEDVEAILSWDDSRHTLLGNTTIVSTDKIEELARGTLLGGRTSVTLPAGGRVPTKKD